MIFDAFQQESGENGRNFELLREYRRYFIIMAKYLHIHRKNDSYPVCEMHEHRLLLYCVSTRGLRVLTQPGYLNAIHYYKEVINNDIKTIG